MTATPTTLDFDELNRLSDGTWSPFDATDRIVRGHVRRVVRRFGRLRSAVAREDDADALMRLVWACYADLWQWYAECLSEAHSAAVAAVLGRSGQLSASAAFERYAASYALPEGYVPESEWERKRSRAFESAMASKGAGRSASRAVTTARNVWARQLRQGADDMTCRGVEDAYGEAGVARVRWVTEHDDRVCDTCRPLDGRTYALGKAPQWPAHYNCRCLLVPVA